MTVPAADRTPLATVRVDEALCLSSQMCVRMAPHLFRSVDGVTAPVDGELTVQADVDLAEDVAHACPFGAIEVSRGH